MGEERAAMVFTDPPYDVPIDGHASGLGAIHHHPFPMVSGEMDEATFIAFLAEACRNLAAFSLDGSIHFVCIDRHHLGELGRRPENLWRAHKPRRLGQGQWRGGLTVSQPA